MLSYHICYTIVTYVHYCIDVVKPTHCVLWEHSEVHCKSSYIIMYDTVAGVWLIMIHGACMGSTIQPGCSVTTTLHSSEHIAVCASSFGTALWHVNRLRRDLQLLVVVGIFYIVKQGHRRRV